MIQTRLMCDSCKGTIGGPFICWGESEMMWVKNPQERETIFKGEPPKDYCGINCFLKAIEILMKEKRGILDIK